MGSEMCIRDRFLSARNTQHKRSKEYLAGAYRPDKEWRKLFRDEIRSRIRSHRNLDSQAYNDSAPSDTVPPRPQEKAGRYARKKANMTSEERTAFNRQTQQAKRRRQTARAQSSSSNEPTLVEHARSVLDTFKEAWRDVIELGDITSSAVSYTHLTLPTKRIV